MRISLLGPLEIQEGSRRLGPADFGGLKPKQLLEILLTERGHVVTRDKITDLLWGEDLPRDAAATIETYISMLRRRLEPEARHARECRHLLTERPGYRFDASGAEVDADRFNALIEEGRRARAGGDMERAGATYAAAIALYRDDYLVDEPDARWAVESREGLKRAFADLLAAAAEVSIAQGRFDAALRLAKQATEVDPAREESARMSMLAAYALGQQEEALRVYERLKGALTRELGVGPTQAMRELHTLILRGTPAQQLLSEVAPAASARYGAPEEVPFLGRQPEIAALEQSWHDTVEAGAILVLVEGEPGIGKSRLISEFLRREDFRCGWVKCSELERDLPFSALTTSLADLFRSVTATELNAALAAGPALAEMLPELAPSQAGTRKGALPPEAARIRLLDSVAHALGTIAPTALFIDDLQWTDASSIQALGRILQRARDHRILLLAASRPAATSESPAAMQLIEMARSAGRLRSIVLEPLPRAALDALLARGADPAELWAATGGHPLFLAEWLRAGKGSDSKTRSSAAIEPQTPFVSAC